MSIDVAKIERAVYDADFSRLYTCGAGSLF
ncbi:hypothetical protein DFR42_1011315 [Undibacterium pigrum]|uniref:Uncharacterized protein n=1 Tax=Undibacterium pigrum TaxID=401470 RepID=A0A318JDP7_9BURK|nr:hypothetical protein DFR42_1011315 [Undibacterium pigrum]